MLYPPHHLLQVLQRFINQVNQVNQIHALVVTSGHLLRNSKSSNLKWMRTLLYNTLIRAHLNLGDPHKAILLFTHMLAHRAPPNNHTFPSLIKAAASSPSLASLTGRPVHTQAIKWGLSLDPFIQTSLIRFYAQFGGLIDAGHIFEEITEPCIVAFNSMLDALSKHGDMNSALLLFHQMPRRDVVSWTSIINGFVRKRYHREAILFFEEMMMHKDVNACAVRPTEATLVTVLSSCANFDGGGVLHLGKQIHGYIVRNEIEVTVFLGTALISLYGKTGSLGSASIVFNEMMVKEVCTWNAMICSFASNGRETQALSMFNEMRFKGLRPNEVTFVAVLTACARAKLVERGMGLFHSMLPDFGIVPKMEHYGCMVDLLGRAGLLEEASGFVNKMPFEPDETVLGALLGACKVHGAIELGNDVGRRLLELQPQHCGRYVVLSNINASAGRWAHAAEVRRSMIEAGIRKIPAHSWLGSF